MNKRSFLKSIAALSGSAFLPSSASLLSMYKTASAAVDYEKDLTVIAPDVMPQVINIFLYGGPSELSGNLTNIQDIEVNSQNSYVSAFDPKILINDAAGDGSVGWITKNGFWRGTARTNNNFHLDNDGAGGRAMQFLLDTKQMSVYRTLMKSIDGTRSHRESLLMSLKGSLDINTSAGVGTKIAATLINHSDKFVGKTLADGTPIIDIVSDPTIILPFVSFEGETPAFAKGPDFQVPFEFGGITLDDNFSNPFSRSNNTAGAAQVDLDALVNLRRTNAYDARYSGAANSFDLRATLEQKIKEITTANTSLPNMVDPSAQPGEVDADAASIDSIAGDPVKYPDTGIARKIRASVTLALLNPSSFYITVGDGFGSWDDHNNGVDRYPDRMNDLFEALKAAMLHIKYADASRGATQTINGNATRRTDNIVINMFGDFGRRVNLNGQGWDHGNNQNLFTFGGAGVRPGGAAALGKVVGRTVRVGDGGTNNQVTEPDAGSYTFEPMAVASSVYSYFGVQNPEVLTAGEVNPEGVAAIDEANISGKAPSEPNLF